MSDILRVAKYSQSTLSRERVLHSRCPYPSFLQVSLKSDLCWGITGTILHGSRSIATYINDSIFSTSSSPVQVQVPEQHKFYNTYCSSQRFLLLDRRGTPSFRLLVRVIFVNKKSFAHMLTTGGRKAVSTQQTTKTRKIQEREKRVVRTERRLDHHHTTTQYNTIQHDRAKRAFFLLVPFLVSSPSLLCFVY